MQFEKKLKRIEEIVQEMESGEITLDQALKLFEEGVKLSRDCHSELQNAETKVQELMKVNDDGSIVGREFQATSSPT